jgi:hypothetical protein
MCTDDSEASLARRTRSACPPLAARCEAGWVNRRGHASQYGCDVSWPVGCSGSATLQRTGRIMCSHAGAASRRAEAQRLPQVRSKKSDASRPHQRRYGYRDGR